MADTSMGTRAPASGAVHADTPSSDASAAAQAPGFWRTYALAYSIGAVWLALEILVLGTQPKYDFGAVYTTAFVLPPFLTAFSLLLVDRPGPARTIVWRGLALAIVAGLASVLSTVAVTPVLVLMFRAKIGFSLSASAAVSVVSLVALAVPLVIELVASGRSRRWLHTAVIAVGLAVVGVALAMAFAPAGPLASRLRLDQGELLMITSPWWLPVYALTTAYARRIGLA